MEVGEKLKELRIKKNMTRYRLTQLTGVSGHHIKGIEEGTRQPTIDTLSKITNALGCSLAELFNDDAERCYLCAKERRLINNYRTMSAEKADALLNMSELLK